MVANSKGGGSAEGEGEEVEKTHTADLNPTKMRTGAAEVTSHMRTLRSQLPVAM